MKRLWAAILLLGGCQTSAPARGPDKARTVAPTSQTSDPSANEPDWTGPRFLAPAAFSGETLSFDLPSSPHGKTRIAIVPALRWSRPKRRANLEQLSVPIQIGVASGAGSPRRPGAPLRFPRERLSARDWPCPDAGRAAAPPEKRSFRVYDVKTDGFVSADGNRVSSGPHYAIYEDTANRKNFTSESYRALQAALEKGFPEVVRLFGRPAGVDERGRILVFVSRTAAEHSTKGQAYFNVDDFATDKVVTIWSLDGFQGLEERYLAEDFFPRDILHETAHVCQYTHALRMGRPVRGIPTPLYVWEGSAEILRLVGGLGTKEKWESVAKHLASPDPPPVPFLHEYALGSLYLWWLQRTWGDGIHQALLDAAWDEGVADVVEKATGLPEPLSLAVFSAFLSTDEALPAKVRDLCRPSPLAVGQSDQRRLRYTGSALYEVVHDSPIRVTLTVSDPSRAYVVLVPE